MVVGFVLILAGALFGWRWIRNPAFRWVHLGCIGVVAVESVVGLICPLTLLENWLLVGSGQAGYERTFIGKLIFDLLYYDFAAWVFTIVYVSLAALTVLTLVLIPPVRRSVVSSK